MTYHYGKTDQHDCLYNAARAYPGGVEALAHRMGYVPSVLYKKLMPGVRTHNAHFEDAAVVMEHCRDANVPDALAALDALAFRLGKVCIDIPDMEDGEVNVEDIQRLVYRAMSQLGEAVTASTDALIDGHVSEKEMREIEPKLRALLPTITAWLNRMKSKSKADAGKFLHKIMRKQKEVA